MTFRMAVSFYRLREEDVRWIAIAAIASDRTFSYGWYLLKALHGLPEYFGRMPRAKQSIRLRLREAG